MSVEHIVIIIIYRFYNQVRLFFFPLELTPPGLLLFSFPAQYFFGMFHSEIANQR